MKDKVQKSAKASDIPSVVSLDNLDQSTAYNAAITRSSSDNPESLVIADEFLANIEAMMPKEDKIMWLILNELLDQDDVSLKETKVDDTKTKGPNQILAEALGISVKEVVNAKKRLKRLLEPFFDPDDLD